MRRGYARSLDDDTEIDRQAARLRAEGCGELLLERDGGASGRVRLDEYLYAMRAGDEVVAIDLTVFGRSTGKLAALLHQLAAKGVTLRVLEPSLFVIEPRRPGSALELLAALAEHERRRRAHPNGRKRALTKDEAADALERYRGGESLSAIARGLGVERGAVTQALSGRRRVGESLYRAQAQAPRVRPTALHPRPAFELLRRQRRLGDD